MKHPLIALCLALASAGAGAQEVLGVVAGVASGDRLVVKTPERTIDVILAQVEAPAHREPLWQASRQSLVDLCYGKAATLTPSGTARDGSTIGDVSCGGISAAREQLRRGMAKVEPPFVALDELLREAEAQARSAGVGIWGGESVSSR